MELKDVIAQLQGILNISLPLLYPQDKEAIETAISHLETLLKVQEMGGVKKKEEEIGELKSEE